MIGVADETETARANSVIRVSRPIPKCHPDRPFAGSGLCPECYAAAIAGRRVSVARTPTPGQVAALLAVIEHSTLEAAACALGIALTTLRRRLSDLYRRIGAEDRAHAAWLLYPTLGDRYVLPGGKPRLRAVA